MGVSGYTSLSIEEKRYARLRRSFDTIIDTEKTFTVWAIDVLDAAVNREGKINQLFPGLKYVGKTSKGIVIQDQQGIIEITTGKNFTCSVDKGLCKHILFTVMHPEFQA